MNERQAAAAYARLLRNLHRAVALLGQDGEEHWAAWLSSDAGRIRAGDAYGLDHLLSAYGGMGSINDLGSGRLRRLLSKIYDAAAALRRSLNED